MSHPPLPSANSAASALLHLGMTLTAVVALMFFVVHFGHLMHAGKALLYAVAGAGGVLILRSVVQVVRELARPLPPSRPRRAIRP